MLGCSAPSGIPAKSLAIRDLIGTCCTTPSSHTTDGLTSEPLSVLHSHHDGVPPRLPCLHSEYPRSLWPLQVMRQALLS